jgi:hypothetical protein
MERLPIDLRLWALVSGVLLLAFAIADASGALGDGWQTLAGNLRQWRAGSRTGGEAIGRAAPRLLVLGVVAGFVGWALHGLAVIGGLRLGRGAGRQTRLDYQEPADVGAGPGEPWEDRVARLAALRRRGELVRRGRRGRPPLGSAAEPGRAPDRGGN